MTGPEHYFNAEELIERARLEELGSDKERYYLGVAQIHATLALAAATAVAGRMSGKAAQEWDVATRVAR